MLAIAALALAGIAVAGVPDRRPLRAHGSPICTTGGCEKVQHSSYAELAGVPVALLGPARVRRDPGHDAACAGSARARRVRCSASSGAAFSGYLLWAQLARIHAICQWCVGNDAIIAAVAGLCVARLLREPSPA